MDNQVELSIIIPISERHDDITLLHEAYAAFAESLSVESYEFIYVLDGQFTTTCEYLESLTKQDKKISIISFSRRFGESAAMSAGFVNSNGRLILTLPAYVQVDMQKLGAIFEEIRDHDLVVVRRWPRVDSWFNRLQAAAFDSLQRWITKSSYHDLGCGIRLLKQEVAPEIQLYGDQHRFYPILADIQGFKVKEIEVPQSQEEAKYRLYSPGIYLRRLLDLSTVFFLSKFTKKPLRFFGLLGSSSFFAGVLLLVYVSIERFWFAKALADRPTLLLGTLLVVLGVQIFALGLVGELVIFSHSKKIKEYKIEKIIN